MTLKEIERRLHALKAMGYIPAGRHGSTGVGHTFEQKMGLSETNIPVPDLGGRVEIKTTRRDSDSLVTLFCFNRGVWHIARASLEELLLDYHDFLRQQGLLLWEKDHPQVQKIRGLAYASNRSYMTYKTYIETSPPETAANTIICLIHQANYLLDQQLRQLEKQFLEEGGLLKNFILRANGLRENNSGHADLQSL